MSVAYELSSNKTNTALEMTRHVASLSHVRGKGIDVFMAVQLYAGIMVETALYFESPIDALSSILEKLTTSMDEKPYEGELPLFVCPPGYIVEDNAERGRELARQLICDWEQDIYGFVDLIVYLAYHNLSEWDNQDIPLDESSRLVIECAWRAMAYEIAAQELCDASLDHMMVQDKWSLADCLVALSGSAGQLVRAEQGIDQGPFHPDQNYVGEFSGVNLPVQFDEIAYVMTREAARHGVSNTVDWRAGLAANDCPADAPTSIVQSFEPYYKSLLPILRLENNYDCAVACAKAAGRMIAVVSGGEEPEIASVIAKPLALAAMIEMYKKS
tara:strand:+ start:169676 stop:170662 length:987 start_codon:yes stop_codon:yes gene_type:complete